MDKTEMIAYVSEQRHAVVSPLGADGRPQAAYLPLTATDAGELVFDAKLDSRKISNIRRDPRIAVVMGGADGATLQIEGHADVLDGSQAARYGEQYLRAFPEFTDSVRGRSVVIVRVRPEWARFSDFRGVEAAVEEVPLPENRL
ncbi:pyridoxamine 5'-phosphate oxidase family protein [Microbacterium aerolatum]|uniref:pyridoxamine 5'-phosphate oxidase family protein n=1 Tax=Microbacterium aerolatum TaxID=153731 RepID=UPI002001488C|nr:pyridoxamine 5'-phosphate oxidase family protein [Microbacterium aerolatum]MCK3769292.1 pyridoxamine 5'-phosphate oxidase family protein [Microbacterium aerolatum]